MHTRNCSSRGPAPGPRRRVVAAVTFATAVVSLSACGGVGPGAASSFARPPAFEPTDPARCGAATSYAHPLVVEWPSADRVVLEHKLHQGLVAVRYVGCEMQVLERCSAPNVPYAYFGATRAEDRVVIKNDDELYANLPFGAAKLEGQLRRLAQLTVDLDLVGRYEAAKTVVRADELEGDCRGATHFVYGASVGAFDFHAGADATLGAGVRVVGIGANARSAAERETVTRSGDESACAQSSTTDAAPPDGCGALVRVELVPLGKAKEQVPVCPTGTEWNGSACLAKKVVTDVECPPPAKWTGHACVSTEVVTAVHCPDGAWWDGKTCAAKVVCPPDMTWLRGGRFERASGYADEPETFSVQPLCMDTTEVTADAYAACVRAKRCSVDRVAFAVSGKSVKVDPLCNYGAAGRGDHPMNCVSWDQAEAYCHAKGKRLPTEWEWVWAALGTDPGSAEHGPTSTRPCWKETMGTAGTCAVDRAFAAEMPAGLHDLDGNVSEWTSSRHPWGGMTVRGASWADASHPKADVLGYWHDAVDVQRPARHRYAPGERRADVGFRCVR